MMTKKIFPFLFALLTLVLLTSCTDYEPRYRIGVSQCSDDAWRHQMNKEIIREALFYDKVEVEICTAHDSNEQQKEDIHHFINEGVDLLVVAPNEAAPITPVVEEAYNRGIPVIVVDRKILSDKYTAYVGADNYEIGKAIGNYIAVMLHGKGNIAELTGLSGSTPAMDRHQGFVSAIAGHPGLHLLAHEDAGWRRPLAEGKMDTMLSRFSHIDVVYAQNDPMAAGAYTAALQRGRERDIRFIGTDALPGKDLGVEQVLSGKLDATFIYPTGGDKVMQIAMKILKKQQFPRETLLNTSVVDKTNALIMQMQTAHIFTLDEKIEMLNGKINQYLDRYTTQKIMLYGSLLMLLLVIGLLIAVYFSLRAKNKLNNKLSLQKQKLELQRDKLEQQKLLLEGQKSQLERLSRELEEATHAKLVFFTNVSHDFRTPLTLISDPVNQLLEDSLLSERTHHFLELIKKNVNILLRLVNQILDFRKVENGRMEFHCEPFDMLENFRSWNDSFRMAFLKKHISFHFEISSELNFNIMADGEKMECIYFNLLSNAVKYTPENGSVVVKLDTIHEEGVEGETEICFSVFNSGSYISPQEVEAVFERFYQVSGHQAGTGIGLALVHAFVEMHSGHVSVNSDRKGTTFYVTFPIRSIEFQTPSVSITLPDESIPYSVLEQEAFDDDKIPSSDLPSILIIDDNPDIRQYVKMLLTTEYNVLEAQDANVGIRLAMKYVPDVIVSDVMMPGMDGIECCRHLKSEVQTCHIPVILLTACCLDEQRMHGYDGGADSYISKPFSSQLLLSRIRNLIASRRQLRQFLGDEQMLVKEDISDMDKDFVSRFRVLIEKKMKESGLNVEDLGRDMGMSRVQLYRKLKFLTNYSPNELLRQMRLKKAASLLASSDLTVAEIAYEVGFSSPSYFTKCYREEFGESPTDLLKRKEGSRKA